MRIKALICCSILSLYAFSVSAQNKDNRYHEYGTKERRHINGYIGPLAAFSNIEGTFSVDLGATAGVFIKQKFFIGLYGQQLVTKPPRTDLAIIGYPTYTSGEIGMIHGGGVLGYIHKPEKEIHWGISTSGGIGVLKLFANEPVAQNRQQIYDDRIIIVAPKFFVEMNIKRWFKINLSGGYRFIGKVNGTYVNQAHETIPTFYKADYTKPEFSISLLFGSFGINSGMIH